MGAEMKLRTPDNTKNDIAAVPVFTSGATVKVSTEVLKQQADAVTREIGFLEQYFTEMEELFKATSGYWIGEAGDNLRSIYSRKIPDTIEMLKRLKEHPRDLMLIAQKYEETESQNVSTAALLTGNVID